MKFSGDYRDLLCRSAYQLSVLLSFGAEAAPVEKLKEKKKIKNLLTVNI